MIEIILTGIGLYAAYAVYSSNQAWKKDAEDKRRVNIGNDFKRGDVYISPDAERPVHPKNVQYERNVLVDYGQGSTRHNPQNDAIANRYNSALAGGRAHYNNAHHYTPTGGIYYTDGADPHKVAHKASVLTGSP